MFVHHQTRTRLLRIWLSGIFIIAMYSSCLAAAPGIDVVSPSTVLWTASDNVLFDVNIVDSSPSYAFIDWNGSLVGWWRGEGDATDSSSSGNDGVMAGGAYASGAFGQCFDMDDSASVTIGDVNEVDFRSTDDWTWSCWVNKPGSSGHAYSQSILSKGAYTRLYLHSEDRWQLRLGNSDSSLYLYYSRSGSTGNWVHLVITYDGATRAVKMYVDGTYRAGGTITAAQEFWTSSPFVIGQNAVSLVDEVMVFNRALQATEIAALYNANVDDLAVSFTGVSEMVAYPCVIHAVNASGEHATESNMVTVDVPDSAPTGTVTNPLSPTRSSSTSQTFTAVVRDTNSDTTLTAATLYWDFGQEFGATSYTDDLSGDEDTVSIPISGLTGGTITWNLYVEDSDGNGGFIAENQTLIIGQSDYYVSTTGDDGAAGTIDAPFATIQHFADIAYPGDTCYIRAGTYRETVTPARSGNTVAPIIYRAYPGETVIVSGADPVSSGWASHSGTIYKTTAMTWNLGKGKNQIFVNGLAMIEARWPNTTDIMLPQFASIDAGSSYTSKGSSGYSTFVLNDADLTQANDYWVGAIVHATWSPRYHALTGEVTSSTSGTINAVMPLGIMPSGTMTDYGVYYLTGHYGCLDAAGEWYYDDSASTLYLWVPGGGSPSGVEAKARDCVFDLDGISYTKINDVTIFASTIATDIYSSHVTLDGLTVSYPSHYTVIDAPIGDLPINTGQTGIRNTGVILDGEYNSIQNSTIAYSAGNGVSLIGNNNTVDSCTIHSVNYVATECGAVQTGGRKNQGNRITDCTLYKSGRSILVHNNAQNLSILRNEMYDNSCGGETGDLGVTYCIGTDGKGTEIAYNRIHDFTYAGIYFDYSSHNFSVHHNVVWDCRSAAPLGMHLNTPSTGHNIYHNTFGNTWLSINASWDSKVMTGTNIKNNIGGYVARIIAGVPTGYAVENNVQTAPVDPTLVYADYSNDDFHLCAGSAAIDAGLNVGFTQDANGNPIIGTPDIGAYEYVDASTSYVLGVTAENGSVARSPDKESYVPGEAVTIQVAASTGYRFVGWSGDLTGSDNPATITMDGNKSVTANFVADVAMYSLSVAASGGSVSRSPDQASYTSGTEVTLVAVANAGYTFTGWSGAASGTSSSVTVTMDADKSVTANFTANAYTLAVASTNGSVAVVPQKTTYSYGETVSVQAVPSTGYHFTGWSGDLSGSSNPMSLVMNDNKSVTAGFSINTYTLNATAVNGSVTRSPDQTLYNYGETVNLQAVAADGYEFTGWSGALSGTANPIALVMSSDKSVTATFEAVTVDEEAPMLLNASPAADAIQTPLNSLVSLHIADVGEGVDANTVNIAVNGASVYSGNVASYTSGSGVCRRVGTKADYTYAYQAASDFDYDATVTVTVSAADLEGNAMTPQSYSFRTQMRAFGPNRCASWGPDDVNKGSPATVSDASGNLWVVYHAGVDGARDIYVSELADGSEQFGSPVQVTKDILDECNPDIAIGTDGRFTIVWQDNRRGNWDIYASTSDDGVTWSSPVAVTDSNDNEIQPAIAVDSQSPNRAYVTWEDSRSGNQDVWVAVSSDGFVSKTAKAVTSNALDQTDPRIAVDASNVAYIVWTDSRNGTADVYGAASNSGPWSNVAVATGAGNQSAPVIAAEPTGSTLHFAWVSDVTGDNDVCYAASNGLPANPLVGVDIIDDSSGANQEAPAIAVAEGVDVVRIFVCWQDARNVGVESDTDIYAIEIRDGDETNLLVGDGGTSTNQSEPAMAIDAGGRPSVVWTDDRNATKYVYFAATTSVASEPLDEKLISSTVGGTVGAASPAGEDDVSVMIPAGACPYDVTVSVAKIQDLQPSSFAELLPYEFGPSGLQFDAAVTITMPYLIADYGSNPPQPYWYDTLTGALTQQGITNIEYLALSTTVGALRFQTTHFTPYTLVGVASDDGSDEVPSESSSSGGGCSLAPGLIKKVPKTMPSTSNKDKLRSQWNPTPTGTPSGRLDVRPTLAGIGLDPRAVEYFVPYAVLAAIMVGLRRRDVRRYRR